MIYLRFLDEQSALIAEQKIIQNIRNFIEQRIPERATSDGLLSTDVKGNVNSGVVVTNKWATPEFNFELNAWIIPKPTQQEVGRVPIESVLNGVGGEEIEF